MTTTVTEVVSTKAAATKNVVLKGVSMAVQSVDDTSSDGGSEAGAFQYRKSIKVEQARLWTSLFTPRLHALGDALCHIDNEFFLDLWPFDSNAQRQFFLDMDIPRWTAMSYAEARDSRMLTCAIKLHDLLQTQVLGSKQPLAGKPWSVIMVNSITEMETLDNKKTPEVFDALARFWRAQVSLERPNHRTLEAYLAYRDLDVGLQFCRALARWAMDITLPPDEKQWLRELGHNASAQIVLVNDLFSWEKEVLEARDCEGKIGGYLFNAIAIVMEEQGISEQAARVFLARKVQDVENNHFRLVAERAKTGKPIPPDVLRYIDCLEDMCAGNEAWSRITARYYVKDGKRQKPTEENVGFRNIPIGN
ncbi:hypothetical protein FZEAL_10654 [Fusarium zealandicum]|uniref:Terpene synthase n=1 Tax=Fusarium zealandicum TaxID=1053134 RepID=A0A8H4TYK0_9HYPO|nr:hypothetical protein FZEAL_10654 [Fusarium zealandicum]